MKKVRNIIVALAMLVGLVGGIGASPASAARVDTMRCTNGWTHQHFTNHWDACVYRHLVGGMYYVQWVESRAFSKIHPTVWCSGIVANGGIYNTNHVGFRC